MLKTVLRGGSMPLRTRGAFCEGGGADKGIEEGMQRFFLTKKPSRKTPQHTKERRCEEAQGQWFLSNAHEITILIKKILMHVRLCKIAPAFF